MALLPGLQYNSPPAGGTVRNASVTSQAPTAAVEAVVVGTAAAFPQNTGVKVGTRFRAKFSLTKTAAGTAASTIAVSLGILGTVADAVALSFTKPAGTAAVDEGFAEIDVICRSVNETAQTAVFTGEFRLVHNLAATGHATIPVVVVNAVSGAVALAEAQIFAVSITTGAADAVTIEFAESELSQF